MSTRTAYIADVHVGNHRLFGGKTHAGVNDRALRTINTLSLAARRAYSIGCENLVVAGDLFDTDLPSPALIHATGAALWPSKFQNVVIVNGNHDMTSTGLWHTAVSPLEAYEDVCVVQWPQQVLGMFVVPHQPGPAKEWLPAALDGREEHRYENHAMPHTLVTHLGIEHAGTPPWLRGADDSVHVDQLVALCKKYGFRTALSGNWHQAWETTVDGVYVRQIGALVPTGFDNPGTDGYGCMVVVGSSGVVAEAEIAGPRFLKFTSLAALRAWEDAFSPDGNAYYVHAQVPDHEWWCADEALQKLEAGDLVAGYKISKCPDERRAEHAAAAEAASDAGSLGEALFEYVASANLGGADARQVHRTCRRLLKLGDE